jgi:hypothetical protein
VCAGFALAFAAFGFLAGNEGFEASEHQAGLYISVTEMKRGSSQKKSAY